MSSKVKKRKAIDYYGISSVASHGTQNLAGKGHLKQKKKAEGKMIRQVYCQLIRGLIAKAAFSSVFSRAVGLLLSLLASRGLFLFLLLSTHMCPLRNLV